MVKENKPKSQDKDDTPSARPRTTSATHKKVSPAPAVEPNRSEPGPQPAASADMDRAAEHFRLILTRASQMAKKHSLPASSQKKNLSQPQNDPAAAAATAAPSTPVADKVVVAKERQQAAEEALATLRANQKQVAQASKGSQGAKAKPQPAAADVTPEPTVAFEESVEDAELTEFERQMQEQLSLVVDGDQSRLRRKQKESEPASDKLPEEPPEPAQWNDTRRQSSEPTVEDVRDHATLGPHTIVSRPDGSRLFKNFVKHPDTTMIEQAPGNRLWIRKEKPVCLETREGTWSTNNGGRTWMHREPSAKQIAGMDFRPWRKTGDKLAADDQGNVTIKHKDGSLVVFNVDGSKDAVTLEGTRQQFDDRGLLAAEQFINGGTIAYEYREALVGDPPVPKFVVSRQERKPGQQILERDAEDRPLRMWAASAYRVEVGYDKKGEINKLDVPQIFSMVRKNLPGAKSEWLTTDGEKRKLSRVRITENGTISYEEAMSSGHEIKVTICADGSYSVLGLTLQRDQYIIEGQDGKPTQVTNPSGDQYSFTYDSNGDMKTVSPGKHARSFERTEGKWHHAGAPESAAKMLDLQIKVDYLGDLAITHQVTADYYKVDKRNADGYQSTFTMDMKNGKWVSNERIAGGTYTKTIDTDSNENRAETTYDHKAGTQKREVRDSDEAGYIATSDNKNRTTIQLFGWEGKAQGLMTSNDGKSWKIVDAKGKKLSEFDASIDVHREGMTIKCKDVRDEEMLVRTDSKGVPYYFRDSSGEWTSRNGLKWEQDNGPGLPKSEFMGRPALPDGYPLIAHDERMENFDTVVLVENGIPVRFSSDEGHQYVFKDNRWLLEDKTRKRKATPVAMPPPPKKKV